MIDPCGTQLANTFTNLNLNAFFITNSSDHSDTDVTYLRKIRLKDAYIL